MMTNVPTADEIIRALGGDHRGMCNCPSHADRKPSLHVRQGDTAPLFKCFAGCPTDAIIRGLQQRGIWLKGGNGKNRPRPPPVIEQTQQVHQRFSEATAEERAGRQAKVERAMAVLEAADPTAAARRLLRPYFALRGITAVPTSARWLSIGAAVRLSKQHPELGLRAFPHMVFEITRAGQPVGAHVTALTRDGSAKLAIDDPRRTLGDISGGYVVLATPDPGRELIVAEGIETTLAMMQVMNLLGIAGMTAGNLERVHVPRCAKVIIGADNDLNGVGQRAAEKLRLRLIAAGRSAYVATPKRPPNWKGGSYDWNDRLQAEQDTRRNRHG